MASVDNRVVQMTFDNSRFEQNAKTTQETLKKLDESLAFKNGAKGLTDLEAAGRNFTMGGMGSIVDGISGKFNALAIAGTTALMNITNRAVDAGIALVKSLTIDPIATGLNEYETKINAIQTIMTNTASKGTTLEDVNVALAELNDYADKTIYNFAEMTRNIGTFTAAGVALEPATNAIKGIANLAAGSGSTAHQASTAMYQLSQALAEGRVSLQTWNSVVNAGMGGELFQHALIDTAVNLGDLNEGFAEMIKSGVIPFREAIKASASEPPLLSISTQNLIDTFNRFAEDPALIKAATRVRTFTMLIDTMQESVQSGWAQSWEYIIGDMEEAATFLTEINDAFGEIVGSQAEARNELLAGWKVLGGRDDLIQAFRNIGNAIMSIVTPISEAFNSIFVPMTAFDLANITDQFRQFTESLIISDETSQNLRDTFSGVFAIFDIIGKVVGAAIDVFSSLVRSILPVGEGFLGITASVGRAISSFNAFLEESEVLSIAGEKIGAVLGGIASTVQAAFSALIDTVKSFVAEGSSAFDGVSDIWANRFAFLATASNAFSTALEFLGGFLDKVVVAVKVFWEGFKSVFGRIATTIGEAFGESNFAPALDLVNGGIFAALLLGIKKFFKELTGVVGNFSSFGEGIKKLLEGAGEALNAFSAKVKSEALKNVAVAVGILAASLFVISTIDQEKLLGSLSAIAGLFIEMFGAITLFSKLGMTGGLQLASISGSLIGISGAVLILSFAMKNLAGLDWDGIGTSLVGLAGAMLELIGISKLMSMLNVSGIKGSVSFVIFAGALVLLTKALMPIASLSWTDMAKGIAGLGAMMLELIAFSKLAGKISIASSVGVTILAAGILVLGEAVLKFAAMDVPSMVQGLIGLGAVLLELGLFTKLIGNNFTMLPTAIGLTILSGAMHIFASAISKLGSMSIDTLVKGLLAMGAALAEIGLAMRLMPKNIFSTSVGLVVVSAALVVISKAVKNLGGMSWEELAKGLVALGGSLGILAVALNLMKGTISGSAALVIATTALYGLSGVLKILGTMSWEDIGQSLVALAGSLGILVGAGALANLVWPGILALSAAIVALGVGLLFTGAGIALFASGLAALVVAGPAGINLLIQAAKSLIDLLPHLFKRVGEALVELAKVITNGAPALAEAFIALVRSALSLVGTILPDLARFLFQLLSELLATLVDFVPQLVDQLVDLFIGIIDAIIPRVPEIIKKGAELIKAIFDGISEAAVGFSADQLSLAFLELTAAFFILSKIPITGALTAIANLGIIVGGLAVILTALGGLQQIPGLQWLLKEGSNLLGEIGRGIGLFVGSIVGGFGEGMTNSLPQIGESLSTFMENVKGFLDGLKYVNEDGLSAVGNLVLMVAGLTAASFLESITSWITGKSSILEFGKDLEEFGPSLKSFNDSIKGITPSAITAAASASKMLAEFANNVPERGGIVGWFMGENSLTVFAEELASFAPALADFAGEVKGITPASVSGAVNAAKLLSDFASNLPNQGGVVGWFMGENSMKAFAEDLAEMGPSLKKFSDDIDGFKPGIVTAAANAAKTVTEMAKGLPEQGGVVGWFMGEGSLAKFGEELAAFGPFFASYASSVENITPEAVIASANAAKALAEMANALPEKGGVVEWFTGSDEGLVAFGKSLAGFGPYFKSFALSTKNVDPDVVTASATAAKSLAEMAAALPSKNGVVEWFTGSNTLSEFGKELVLFGPSLAKYSNSVNGKVSLKTVDFSIAAAKAVAAFAETLPNQGGVVSWFTGENTLSAFGEELAKFGPYLAEYSNTIKGAEISVGVIEASASAANIMKSFAETLPNQGGVVSWFTGDNTLSVFGKELAAFAPYLLEYSQGVVGVHLGAVEASVAAIGFLSDIASTLQNQGGLVSWFTGDNTLSSFGKDIKDLGTYLLEYSEIVVNVQSNAINTALRHYIALGESAQIIADTDWTKVGDFSNALKNLASIGLADFANEFTEETPRIEMVIREFVYDMVAVFTDSMDLFAAGTDTLLANGLIQGIIDQGPLAVAAMETILNNMNLSISGKTQATYTEIKTFLMNSLIKGVDDSSSEIETRFTTLVNDSLDAMKRKSNEFRKLGNQFALGLKTGILDKAKEVAQAAAKLVQDALNAANAAADVNSPSRKTYWTGQMIVQGLVNALVSPESKDQTNRAGFLLGQNAIEAVNASLSETPQLTITPVLDLSTFDKQRTLMEQGFIDTERAISYASSAMRTPSSVVSTDGSQNGSGLLGGFNFVQNNYSPRALTRAEIYRQTHNLLSTAKGAVTGV